MWERFKAKYKLFIDRYVRFVQRILVTVLLTLIYVFGLGLITLLIRIFKPSMLRLEKGDDASTFWHDAKAYGTIEESKRQS